MCPAQGGGIRDRLDASESGRAHTMWSDPVAEVRNRATSTRCVTWGEHSGRVNSMVREQWRLQQGTCMLYQHARPSTCSMPSSGCFNSCAPRARKLADVSIGTARYTSRYIPSVLLGIPPACQVPLGTDRYNPVPTGTPRLVDTPQQRRYRRHTKTFFTRQ